MNSAFSKMKTLLSIHNLENKVLIPSKLKSYLILKTSHIFIWIASIFLKCGIMRANGINTVSENYRNEILTRFYGFTLDGPLKARQSDLYGILNGLDQDLYDPMKSKIYVNYGENDFIEGKAKNKDMLIQSLKLDSNRPVTINFIYSSICKTKRY